MPMNQGNPFVARIREHADEFRAEAAECEKLGRLSDRTVELMRELDLVRMLQPRTYGGHEVDPQTFLEANYELAALSGAAGWVSGVVGLHPWEIAQLPDSVQQDIWGEDPHTWISSPYAPIGRGTAVDGGLVVTGRWPFASGTDHCDWAVLGGFDVDNPGVPLHFVIPKSDITVHHDSWDVPGLRGTGSKDISVTEAFVPADRIIEADGIAHGNADPSWENTAPLYRMPFWVFFPAAIAVGTLGIAKGAVDAYIREVSAKAEKTGNFAQTTSQMIALSNAASDVDAGYIAVLDAVNASYDAVTAGRSVTIDERVKIRLDQTTAVRRAFDAVVALYQEAGSLGIRPTSEFSRFFRDLTVGTSHHSHSPEPFLRAYAHSVFGQPLPTDIRIGPAPTRDAI